MKTTFFPMSMPVLYVPTQICVGVLLLLPTFNSVLLWQSDLIGVFIFCLKCECSDHYHLAVILNHNLSDLSLILNFIATGDVHQFTIHSKG